MNRKFPQGQVRASLPRLLRWVSIAALCFAQSSFAADQVDMQNGDHYVGKVLSVTTNTVVLQNEVLGTVNLPRARVANISLGTAGTNALPKSVGASERPGVERENPAVATNGNLSSAFRQLGGNTNFIKDVQSQYLKDAGPEANAKFNEMVSGLLSGKLNVSDIRREAQSAATQLRAAKKDLGNDDSGVIDEYLAILDKFVAETASAGGTATNNPAALKPKAALRQQ